mmetsp:Transcript_2513/g.3696  ORF Transcript_2513/g.3696 Transcript_2513/m.3696 type:complete len:259 (-) Transcript_2513:68-844(-)
MNNKQFKSYNTTALVDKAIILSNKAVQQLESSNDNYHSARQLLRQALTIIICQIVDVQQDSSKKSPAASFFQWSSQISTITKNEELDDETTTTGFVFTRGIYIRSLTTRLEIVKAAICYNTALTHHLLATTQLDDSNHYTTTTDQLLQQAKLFYSRSAQILRNVNEPGEKRRLLLRLLHMVILNNLGQVSYVLVDYHTSQECLDQLQRNIILYYSIHRRRTKKKKKRTCNPTGFCPHDDLIAMHFNTLLDVPMTAPGA